MDAEIAFLMANQGLAGPGKLVYNSFVGTGSIMVAAAHCGAMIDNGKYLSFFVSGAEFCINLIYPFKRFECHLFLDGIVHRIIILLYNFLR